MAENFKIGDKVELLKGQYGHITGSIGRITKSSSSQCWVVEVEGVLKTSSSHSPGVSYAESNLKLVTDPNVFLKNDYVILLLVDNKEQSSSSKGCIPTGWIYQLKEDSKGDSFWPMLDPNNSTSNGYNHSSVKLRHATTEEIAEYQRLGKPYDVSLLKKQENLIINNYPIY